MKRLDENTNSSNNVNIFIPAICFSLVNIIVLYINERPDFEFFSLFEFAVECLVYNAIAQAFAYLTCLYCVLKRNKGQIGVWINYVVWTILLNLGSISEIITK